MGTMQEWQLGHPAIGKDIIEDKDFGHIQEVKSPKLNLNQITGMVMSFVLECSTISTPMVSNGTMLPVIIENQLFASLTNLTVITHYNLQWNLALNMMYKI